MKQMYILVLAISYSLSLHAQVPEKAWMLGGQLTFNTQKDRGEYGNRSKSGAVNILAGRALRENLVAGINVSFSSRKESGMFSTSARYSTEDIYFTYGVFVRQFKNITRDLYLFGQADLSYLAGRGKSFGTTMNGREENTTRGGAMAFTPGLSYRIYKKLQFEIMLPNLVNFQYTLKRIRPSDVSTPDYSEEGWSVGTNFNSKFSSVGYLGAGFYWLF